LKVFKLRAGDPMAAQTSYKKPRLVERGGGSIKRPA